jgi:hypothetical protein
MKSDFHHRVNVDGTVDSICLRCYLTAGSARNESELPALEAAHVCPGRGSAIKDVQRIRRARASGV